VETAMTNRRNVTLAVLILGLVVAATPARFRTPASGRLGPAPVAHRLSHGDACDDRDSRGEDRLPPGISGDIIHDVGEVGLIDVVCEIIESAGGRFGIGLKMRQFLDIPAEGAR